MALTHTEQPSTHNVMSINAITSPSSTTTTTMKSKSLIPTQYSTPILNGYQSPNISTASSHMSDISDRNFNRAGSINEYDYTRRRNTSESSTLSSSPSFSSSNNESDFNSSYSQSSPSTPHNSWAHLTYNDNNKLSHMDNLLPNFDIISDFNSFDNHYNSSSYSAAMNSNDTTENITTDKKGNALKTRRARNKLASAKYRAKKQAQTHIMQNRIMQLATQVMSLRDELEKSKKSETETLVRYERLIKYFQHHAANKSDSNFDRRNTDTALTSLF